MATPRLEELSRGVQKPQHQAEAEVSARLSSVPIAPEGEYMLLKAVEAGGKHTH